MNEAVARVFISHSHADKDFARRLDASLLARRVEVFLDERSITVGQSIPKRIVEGIERIGQTKRTNLTPLSTEVVAGET